MPKITTTAQIKTAISCLFISVASSFVPTAHAQLVSNFAGGGVGALSLSGAPATSVGLIGIRGIGQNKEGDILLISESQTCASRVNAAGLLFRLAGNPSCNPPISSFDTALTIGDNGPATAATVRLGYGSFIVADNLGNTFIASNDLPANLIRKIDNAGILTAYAGILGTSGSTGDNGLATAARLNKPNHAVVDASNNLIFSDESAGVIRKISPNGIITRVAGGGADQTENALALNAELRDPRGIALAADGTMYIVAKLSFGESSGARIRKITPDGKINSIAGNGISGYNGDGIAAIGAQLSSADGITLDPSGTLYIADKSNHRIRKISRNGIISTVLGNGTRAPTVSNVLAANNVTDFPNTILADADGNLYFSFLNANGVRKITAPRMSVVAELSTVGAGTAQTLTATLVDTTLTGTMTFRDNGIDIAGCGDVPIVTGTARCNASFSNLGTRTITAGYSGMTTPSTLNPTGVYSTIGAAASTSVVVIGPVQFTAQIAPNSAGLGQISPSTQIVTFGATAPFTVTANPRHVMRFNNTISNNCGANKTSSPAPLVPIGTGTDTFVTDVMTGSCTVEVSFAPLIPKVNVNSEITANALFTATERTQAYVQPNIVAQTSSSIGAQFAFKAWVTDIAGVPYASAQNVITFKANGAAIAGCVNVPLTLHASNVVHIREAVCTTAFALAGNVTITSEFAGDMYNFPATSSVLNHSVMAQ